MHDKVKEEVDEFKKTSAQKLTSFLLADTTVNGLWAIAEDYVVIHKNELYRLANNLTHEWFNIGKNSSDKTIGLDEE